MITVNMPKLGLTMKEGTIVEWQKKEGDPVAKGDILFVVETEKVSYEVQANESGTMGKLLASQGDIVPIMGAVAYILEKGESAASMPASGVRQEAAVNAAASSSGIAAPATAPVTLSGNGERIAVSPLARRIATENRVNIASIKGTGPGGRIIRDDVMKAIEAGKQAPPPKAEAPKPQPAAEPAGAEDELRPLSSMRRIIAERMTESFNAPHFYLTVEVDVGEMVKTREQLLPIIEKKYGCRLTVTDLLTKAVAKALEDNPGMNCSYAGDSVRIYHRIDIGIVASVEGGLVVPVLRQANKKSLAELAMKRSELAQKAKDRKLGKEDMSGSTFTISNLGMFGIDQFSAILQPPEASILAVGRSVEKPVVKDGQICIRPMMTLTLSIDHRVLDGVAGANFLQSLKAYMENPTLMLA